jgi:hypothetical protein
MSNLWFYVSRFLVGVLAIICMPFILPFVLVFVPCFMLFVLGDYVLNEVNRD